MHVTLINHSPDWATAAIAAGAAILGALVATAGTLLIERSRRLGRHADEHIASLTELSAVVQIYGVFVTGYPDRADSRNPLTVAAHNLDLRLTQRQWLQQLFHVTELLWRAASAALVSASDAETAAINDVLRLVGEFRVGQPIPEGWPEASSHITYLAREAKRKTHSGRAPAR